MRGIVEQQFFMRDNLRGIALRLEYDDTDFKLVQPQMQNRIIQLARATQNPGIRALRLQRLHRRRRQLIRSGNLNRGDFLTPVDTHFHRGIGHRTIGAKLRAEGKRDAFRVIRRADFAANSFARAAIVSSNFEFGTVSSTRFHSTAFFAAHAFLNAANTSARSRRTLRLSVTRVSPPVPGNTASSGTSGSATLDVPSSVRMI